VTVLDASALLALINNEQGSDLVAASIVDSSVGAANLAEVVGKLVDVGANAAGLRTILGTARVTIEPVTAADGEMAGALRGINGGRQLSLGDRCCLSLALRSDPPEVLTADRAWAALGLPITVRLLR
jgi:PIN domain nuclease of toxin-antitoxin system